MSLSAANIIIYLKVNDRKVKLFIKLYTKGHLFVILKMEF